MELQCLHKGGELSKGFYGILLLLSVALVYIIYTQDTQNLDSQQFHNYKENATPGHEKLWPAGSNSLPALPPLQCHGKREELSAEPCCSPSG